MANDKATDKTKYNGHRSKADGPSSSRSNTGRIIWWKEWESGCKTYSLHQIEHEQIRPKFKEPRIHFALVCAAVGCPTLRNEAYVAQRIDEQLQGYAQPSSNLHLDLVYNPMGLGLPPEQQKLEATYKSELDNRFVASSLTC